MKKKQFPIPPELQRFIIHDVDTYFRKRKIIADGGQGSVWMGTDSQGLKYAIKELQKDNKNPNRQIKRYITECANLLRGEHPFVICFRAMTDNYPLTIITEYVSSTNLSKFLTKAFSSQNHDGTILTKIAMCISNAMMFLHQSGIIHRDLKPSNILIGSDYIPKICDFGYVRDLNKDDHPTSQVGTPNWMAPEVIRGEEYTEKCDVFSFAMILFEMATMKRPLEQYEEEEVMNKYAFEKYRPSFPRNSNVPTPLKTLIEECWSEKPKKRPSFDEIFDRFADLEVSFNNTNSSKIRTIAKQLRKDDKKRKIVPPFTLFPKSQKTKHQDYSDHSTKKDIDYKNKGKISSRKNIKPSDSSDSSEIFTVHTFKNDSIHDEYGKPSKRKSGLISDPLNDDIVNHNNAPEFEYGQKTKISKKEPAPSLDLQIDSVSSYQSNNDYYSEEAQHYYPIQPTSISVAVLSDYKSPLFQNELEKVTKSNFSKFLTAIQNHLNGRNSTPDALLLLLKKLNSMLADEDCLDLFCKTNIANLLPFNIGSNSENDNPLFSYSVEILLKACKYHPKIIEENFESKILYIINSKPIEAATILQLYAKVFETIVNPWPLLDMLITEKKKFNISLAGSIVVDTLVDLLEKYDDYIKSRLVNCRKVFCFFIKSPIKENAIEAYKAVTLFYDDEFELPFDKIASDLNDTKMATYVISLFRKIQNVPAVPDIILPLITLAKENKDASEAIINMTKSIEIDKFLINNQKKWMKYPLPTYFDTFRILFKCIVNHNNLKNLIVSDSHHLANLFARAATYEVNNDTYACFEKVFDKLRLGEDFIIELQERDFFVNFFRGIIQIKEEDSAISCVRLLTKMVQITNCDEYSLFYKALQRFASRKDELGQNANECIRAMKSHKKRK